jgi:hypothetical protein
MNPIEWLKHALNLQSHWSMDFRQPASLAAQAQGQTPSTPSQVPPSSMPSSSPLPTPMAGAPVDLESRIRAGYRKYSGGKEVPMEKNIPLLVEAAKKYPIFQQNPYLIPAVSLVETSGGQNWKLNNNPLSWAARVQQAGNYKPQSDSQSIMDMITAVGGDAERGKGYDPETAKTRQAQTAPYEKFRKSNDLKDFATTYEDAGNLKYYPALMDAIKLFQNQ